ncbi:MAG TPA: choice-of-anchor tandem repeat GloVer-containing protein [Chthonomonadaceae bacterium]|nr:choice-of-anchor tandem repeat GloVer-containing protein [Chthonomonadaceae bacterium]
MKDFTNVQGRVQAMLAAGQRWGMPSRRLHLAGLVLALIILLPLAALQPVWAQTVTLTVLPAGTPHIQLLASDGNFYGFLNDPGPLNSKTIDAILARVTPDGTVSTVFDCGSFGDTYPDGSSLNSLVQGRDGNLYCAAAQFGPSSSGGGTGSGTLLKISLDGSVTVLHAFSAISSSNNYVNSDGAVPVDLIQGSDGNFYGTTSSGGASGNGTIFRLTPDGTFTSLYQLNATTDGSGPRGLVEGNDGNFYGLTLEGGSQGGGGVVFRITPSGTYTVLFSFSPSVQSDNLAGGDPLSPLAKVANGDIYGITSFGGANGEGTIFKISPDGTFTTVLALPFASNPYNQKDGLATGSDGNLYATTQTGGTNDTGSIIEYTTGGTFSIVYSFSPLNSQGQNADGAWLFAPLIPLSDGNLYGFADNGGPTGWGTSFRLNLVALSSFNPSSVDAGGSGYTLLVRGHSFQKNAQLKWNTISLTTTYVSTGELKASVPASLIASPGTATLRVLNPDGSSSAGKAYTVLTTTLKLAAATLSRNSTTGQITAKLSLQNVGHLSASNVSLTHASLGAAATNTSLPLNLGSIAAGASTTLTLTYPGSAGTSGQVVSLKVSGAFTGGKFSGSLKLTLP